VRAACVAPSGKIDERALRPIPEETMKLHTLLITGLLNLLALAAPAWADNLEGADRLLCTPVQVTVCTPEGPCQSGPPRNWNIPQFIEVDLAGKRLSTTAASGENRITPIREVLREDGRIFMQGVEAGRAFSWVVSEATGETSVAVALDGIGISVFGACTPLDRD
jgi:hypothetical protein